MKKKISDIFCDKPTLLSGKIELRGRKEAVISCCRGIAGYSPTEIRLYFDGDILVINGENLLCDSYINGAVVVSGRIDVISFVGRRDA